MARSRLGRVSLILCGVSLLAACEKGGNFPFLQKLQTKNTDGEVALNAAPSSSSVKLIERDVEAPEVFSSNDMGLWDGRPSLGGVWVAHPNVTEPERVIIRNQDNGKFVIGALFKRERDIPGPRIQVSSDAAVALGMLAGAPDALNVVALRRQEVPIAEETVDAATETLPPPGEIETASLDPIAAASAALDKVEAEEAEAPAPEINVTETVAAAAAATAVPVPRPTPTAEPTPNMAPAELALATPEETASPAPAPAKSRLRKPFIQIGLFSVHDNAKNTGAALRNAGVVPNIIEQASNGKTYYRVTVGPAPNLADRAMMMRKVKSLGYSDAYYVTN